MARRWRAVLALVVVVGAAAVATPPVAGTTETGRSADYERGSCDPLGGERCSLPFPNDYFTVADPTTATGRRVDFGAETLPANAAGVHVDPTELNRNDGFSPGSAIAVLLPGLDLAASGAAPITDMARSLDADAPIVLIDAESGQRHPYWAELDANAPDDAHRLLFVRPAVNFREGRRYIVALRNLVDQDGQPVAPSDMFVAYRDDLDTGDPVLESRRNHMERLFDKVGRVGVARDELILAWDFTVASGQNLSERVLAMRDDAFAQLGAAAPAFHVDSATPSERDNLAREVRGTFAVPNYLTGDGSPGQVLNNGDGSGDDPIPTQNGTFTAQFICTVPAAATSPDGSVNPGRAALYGHGLLGSAREVLGAGSRFAGATNTTFCATWWVGMSEEDVGTAVAALTDLSQFRAVPDRLLQAHLNFLFLGRLLLHPEGLSSDPAFQGADGTPLLDQQNLSFVGTSQGGILGGATTAIAQDWTRAFLGVPAMNYSTLLDRSVDFDMFAAVYAPAYPDRVDQGIGILVAQMLWDRGENNGYVQHLTRQTYADTPAKQVMMFEAFGDHQVANVATEVMARTIDAKLRAPGLAEGRSPDVEPFWGIRSIDRFPHRGRSYLVVWDFGTPAPPTENVPNRAGEDPHGMGRAQPEVLTLATEFLERGRLVDTCGGGPCQTLP